MATPATERGFDKAACWAGHIAFWQRNGLVQGAFCRRQGLPLSSLRSWRARLGKSKDTVPDPLRPEVRKKARTGQEQQLSLFDEAEQTVEGQRPQTSSAITAAISRPTAISATRPWARRKASAVSAVWPMSGASSSRSKGPSRKKAKGETAHAALDLIGKRYGVEHDARKKPCAGADQGSASRKIQTAAGQA